MTESSHPAAPVLEDDVALALPYLLRCRRSLEIQPAEATDLALIDALDWLVPLEELPERLGRTPDEVESRLQELVERGLVRWAEPIAQVPAPPVDFDRQLERALERGLEHLLGRQLPRGNFGEDGIVDLWETANTLYLFLQHPEVAGRDMVDRALDFICRHQHREGWFNWDTKGDSTHFSTETTAFIATTLLAWGRRREADRVAAYLLERRVEDEYYGKNGIGFHHVYPSVVTYLVNFFDAHRGGSPDNVERELDRVLEARLPWRGQPLYYLTPLYYYKEVLPMLRRRGRVPRLEALLDRMYRSQNRDLGFGYSPDRARSAGLPTAMALRAAVAGLHPESGDRRLAQALGVAQGLLALQQPDGSWTTGGAEMIWPCPDEFTTRMSCVPGLWPLVTFLTRRRLPFPRPSHWLPVSADDRLPRTLFYVTPVDRYCTPVYPTVQALLGLTALRALRLEVAGRSQEEADASTSRH